MRAAHRLALASNGVLQANSARHLLRASAIAATRLASTNALSTAAFASSPALSSRPSFLPARQQQQRLFSSRSRSLFAPFDTGSSPNSQAPISYFSNRQALPANTVIRFVPQQTAWIVERMGKFHRILEPGLAIMIPFLDRIAYVKSLKETAIEIPSQNAITADNVTLELDGVLYTRVDDAYKA
ncbi:hypothetical protein KEM55_004950, partial [Ascosphaera atra]